MSRLTPPGWIPARRANLPQLEKVADLIQEVASQIVLPLWQRLEPSQVKEKGPGDLVTEADLRSEAWLTKQLCKLEPGSLVVGEEAVAGDPTVLERLSGDDPVWVVDPVDGTANFAKGSANFAIIVARIVGGETVQGWIHTPALGQMAIGERGAGVTIDGKVSAPQQASGSGPYSGFAVGHWRKAIDTDGGRFGTVLSSSSAGYEYLQLLTGAADFSAYSRLKPWDHATGAMMVEAAGGTSRLMTDEAYSPRIQSGALLSTMRSESWIELRDFFLSRAPCP